MRKFILWLVVIYGLFEENGLLFVAAIIGTLVASIKDTLEDEVSTIQQRIKKLEKIIKKLQAKDVSEEINDTTEAKSLEESK